MNRVTKVIRPVLLCSLVALSGCFSLSRNAPPQQYYVLGSGAGAAAALDAGTEPNGVPVGIRATRLADYLATPFIVVRRGTSRIEFSEFDRWGEDLARAVNRSLAGHMAARDPSRQVEVAPWPMGS